MAASSRMGLLMASFLAAGCGSSTPAEHLADDAGVPPGPVVGTRSANEALRVVRGFSMRRAGPEASMGHLGLVDLPLVSTTPRTPGFSIAVAQPTTALDLSPDLSARVLRDGVAERIEVADRMLVPRLEARHLQGLLHRADVRLPQAAVGRFALTDVDSKLGIEVALEGAADVPGEVIDGYVVYAGGHGNGAHVVHRPTAEGTEDFVVVPDRGTANLRYRVTLGKDVAGLRLVSNTLEFLDAGGTPRLRVAPPYVVDAAGVRADATINVEGCRFDTNPAGPWGRSVTMPGARSCFVGVGWAATGLTSPLLVDPAWTTTGSMAVARIYNTATLLPSGKVLLAGGSGGPSSAELFDGSGTFAATSGMTTGRSGHTATLLPSGKVLIAGGNGTGGSGTTPLAVAELYDDGTGAFLATGSMVTARFQHTATLLPSGKVLIAGGSGLSSAELFDGTGVFATTGSMARGRSLHTATLLPSGKVLIAGANGSVASELFDGAGVFSTTGGMKAPRSRHTATLLPSGKVLIAGGNVASAELFDGIGSFTTIGPMTSARSGHTATLLSSGKVLVAGGDVGALPVSSAEVFDGTAGFVRASSMLTPRSSHTATMLNSDKVLIAGGQLVSAELFAQINAGSACAGSGDCLSNYCVDGVCCDTACTGACSSCALPGSAGTCSPVAAGSPAGIRTCAPYVSCVSGSCAATCTADSDCTPGNFCSSASVCTPKKTAGLACTGTNQCLSGFCADGYCCNSACTDQCAACDMPGNLGTCSPVAGVVHGTSRAPCDKAGTTCGASCNGTDTAACHYPATTTTCSTNACSSGTATHASYCDGVGKCNDVPTSCAPYACDTTACRSSCTSPTDCAAGFTCTSNVCVALPASKLGDPCMDASTCPSGAFCTDGVCCSSIGCSAGSSCSVNKKGTCAKLAGTSCTSGLECGSGSCADNVCCDRACDGQCEACDVAGSFGTCKAILGAPHGSRTKCDAGTTTCSAKTCDGKDGSKCAALVGSETPCGTASCASATFTSASTCDGAGSCKSPSPQACAPYGCTTTGCRSDCTVATDCADGFTCAASKCVPSQSAAVCNDDRTGSVAKDTGIVTPCVAFRCAGDGKCGTSCGVSEDCLAGYNCDQSTKNCVQAPATSTDSGGCSVSHQDEGTGNATLGMLTGLALLAWRRRSRAA